MELVSRTASGDDDCVFEYWAGNPSVEISHGHICVARGAAPLFQAGSPAGGSGGSSRPADARPPPLSIPKERAAGSCIVLASAVPCYMSASEFCEFVGAFSEETHRCFRHCRVLHGRNPEEYLIVCWLASPEATAALIQQHDGRPYNTIEAGQCRLHRVVGCLRGNWLPDEQPGTLPVSPEARASPSTSPPPDGVASGCSVDVRQTPSPPPEQGLPLKRPPRSPLPEYAVPSGARSPLLLSPAPVRASPLAALTREHPLLEPAAHMVEFGTLAEPDDLFSGCGAPQAEGAGLGPSGSELGLAGLGGPSSSPMAPSGNDKERPFCAVCLEPVDPNPEEYQLSELGGGVPLTILCGHTFHARCLSRWCDATCPVCRFQQHPYKTSCCEVCGQSEGLNICLVCGFIGCTLFQGEGHAQQHFEDTSHTYALEVISQRVWDYAGNGYVHRLLYNHQDGKMVEHSAPHVDVAMGSQADGPGSDPALAAAVAEVSGTAPEPAGAQGGVLSELARGDLLLDGRCVAAKKQESVVSEFNQLLASQMTEQRHFFEERQREMQLAHDEALAELRGQQREASRSSEASRKRAEEAERRNAALENEVADTTAAEEVMRRQIKALEALNQKISGEQRRFEDKLAGQEQQRRAEQQLRSQEVEELQNEIRELELFLQMRRRCQASGEASDLQGSHMVVLEGEPQRGRGGRRSRRR